MTAPAVLSRRQMLARTGLGFGAVALADLLARDGRLAAAPPDPLAPKKPHFPAKARSVIWLFMHGGPSQVDTFDPKPALAKFDGQPPPAEYHGLKLQFTDPARQKLMASRMGFVRCGRSGLEMADAFEAFRGCADDVAVLRGVHHGVFNHTPGIYLMNTGHDRMGRPATGAWVTYGLGCEADDLPAFVVMNDGPLKPGAGVWGSGYLPAAHQGTNLRPGKAPIPNLAPPPELAGADQRRALDLAQRLNRRHADERDGDAQLEARIASYELAFRMQAAAPEATDLAREPRRVRDLYGGGFGEQCLIARRLVERGVRFVQIYHGCGGGGWDTHGGNYGGHLKLIRSIDRGCAGLLKDLKARGLLESTLVVWGGEFGRTPTTEGGDGRDHNPYGFSMWLAGGGVKGGRAVGGTDDLGFKAVRDPLHVHDLHATLLRLLGLDHRRLTYFHQGRPQRLTDVFGDHDIADRLTAG
ncbi:MAG: DUF1501 domain-containing protein [Isosphaera sp.]|nr:DUF1501 domain-containing protein [Isosphaera sp.]